MADEQKLRGRKARMRCRACDTVWLVEGPGAASAADDPPAEKRAAIIRRGAEREVRDLFATRPPDLGSVKQTLRPPAPSSVPPPSPPSVGARNENSLLFRVDQLTAMGSLKTTTGPQGSRVDSRSSGQASIASPPPSVAPPALATSDDEGMIDLAALSTRAPRPAAAPMAPLFSDAPPAAFARDASANDPAQARAKNRRMLIGSIAGAAVVVLLAITGVALAFRGDDPAPRTLAALPPITFHAAAPPVTAAPPADPAPAALTASASASAGNGSDDEQASASRAKGKKGRGKGKGWVAAGAKRGATTKDTAPPPPKRAPKAADPCGCKGDFNCVLACTAKGHK